MFLDDVVVQDFSLLTTLSLFATKNLFIILEVYRESKR